MPSKNLSTSRFWGRVGELPMKMAATYRANRPLPPTREPKPLAKKARLSTRILVSGLEVRLSLGKTHLAKRPTR